jgi:rhodanese-related sulfurtransferase
MIDQVRPSELPDWLKAHAGGDAPPLVLDVREAWELQTASVKPEGFELLAIPMGEIPGRLAELDAARPIACLCHHGGRSQRVALFLAQQGYDKLANIAGGIDAWAQERDPSIPRY